MISLNTLKLLNLLYIEDNEEVRKNTGDTISLLVKKVFTVSCVQEAITIYQENKIDIIITDIDMPGLDGLDFAKLVRENNIHIPIVVVTAYKNEDLLLKAIPLQLHSYLIKPISFTQLKSTLMLVLEQLKKLHKLNITFSTGYTYNLISSILVDKNNAIEKLQNKERLLLNLLIENKNKLTYYEEIELVVWDGEKLNKDSLKVLIGKLRKKIGSDMILNELELGYRFIL